MIAIHRTPPAQMREAHRREAVLAAPPEVLNVGNARALSTPDPLVFRGRVYSVRPVPFEDGLSLLELAGEVERLARDPGPDAFGAYRAALRATADLCWKLLKPRWVPSIVWRLRRNPIRRASMQEIQAILGFFGRCQTTSHI